MRLPLSLLKSFIPLDLPVATIAETLSLLGIEVEAIINEHPSFAHIVVGEILSVQSHPHAGQLSLAEVSDGKSRFQVVCGAPNCREGIKVPFAKEGALLTDADGKQRKIEKVAIRKVSSEGMLCSASELLLWKEETGLLELPLEWETGQDLLPLLWDPIFELSLTPNLGHCLSALGIARELSAAFKNKIDRHKISLVENPKSSLEKKVVVEVADFSLCPRYMCRLIEDVHIGPSPFWLQRILLSCGLKPICNAVDIANFILIELGQPLHAFDFDRIEGARLVVAASSRSQPFLGLDGVEREIPAGTLLISDAKKGAAIAGVLGGSDSAVSEHTRNILLEAAYFDPMAIRRTSKKMGLHTESSHRFERGVDPSGVEAALDEAAYWMAEICKGKIARGKIDLKKRAFDPKPIQCRIERVNQLLGTKLSQNEIEELFHRLGFATRSFDKEPLRVDVPLYRADISEEIDLVEEVARLYGYNNIEKGIPRCATSSIPPDPIYLFEQEIRSRLTRLGLQELLTPDLISPKLAALAPESAQPKTAFLKATYAKTEEYSLLRPSLLPGLLQVARKNIDQKNGSLSGFEIGRIHFLQEGQPIEFPIAALLLMGKAAPHHWKNKPADIDFYDLKGLLENLCEGLKLPSLAFLPSRHLSFHPGRQADMQSNGLLIGSFGEVHPSLLLKLDIKQRIFYAELNLQSLRDFHRFRSLFSPPPHFPSSERDWTISLPLSALIEPLLKAIPPSPLLEKVELIDLYIPENGSHKNATLRFTYRDPLKTISYEEVEATHSKLIEQTSKFLAEPIPSHPK